MIGEEMAELFPYVTVVCTLEKPAKRKEAFGVSLDGANDLVNRSYTTRTTCMILDHQNDTLL
jgi:hypothetical protein